MQTGSQASGRRGERLQSNTGDLVARLSPRARARFRGAFQLSQALVGFVGAHVQKRSSSLNAEWEAEARSRLSNDDAAIKIPSAQEGGSEGTVVVDQQGGG